MNEGRLSLLIYVTQLLLLAASVLLAVMAPPGLRRLAVLACGALEAASILFFSMELRRESALIQLLACIGVLWVTLMLSFSLFDYATR